MRMSTARDRGQQRMSITAARYCATAPEGDLEEILRELCELLWIIRSHQHDSRRSAGEGLPDDLFVGTRVMYREVKTSTGVVSPTQEAFLACLRAAGTDADVWRPEDFASGRVVRELRAISPPPGHPARAAAARYRAAVAQQRSARRKRAP